MTKRLILSLCFVIVVGTGWFLWSIQSREVALTLQGTKYRLGGINKELAMPVKVKIQGRMHNRINGDRVFRGTIDLEGDEIPVPAEQRELNLTLSKDKPGMILYIYTINGQTKFYHVGGLFIDSDFSKAAFFLYEPTKNDGSDGQGWGWSGDNGLMLSAPAADRREALAVSEELMKNWAHAPDFKHH